MVDIDPLKLEAKGLTPLDVVNAVNAQNLTIPAGLAKIGDTQFTVRTNALPSTIADLNNIPVKFVNGATVFVKDVGQVHDGYAVQQNVVRIDGRRSVLLSIIKNGNASTLSVVNAVKQALVVSRKAAPAGMQIKELFDQSVFVKASVAGAVAGGRDRCRSHRADDRAVSRLMALHACGDDLDSAVDPLVARGALFPRRHHQHHDARRPGARHRHSGRRFDGHDREHAPPVDRGAYAAAAGDAPRRRRHRHPDAGIDAGDQLRVRVRRLPPRPGQIPLHSARNGRGIRDARVLHLFAHPDPDHHRPTPQR